MGIGRAYESIEAFEKNRETAWNGTCKFTLLEDIPFIQTYKLELVNQNGLQIYKI